MTRTRQLSGRAKSRFLRDALEQTGAGPDAGAALDAAVVKVWVRDVSHTQAGVRRSTGRRRIPPLAARPTEAIAPAAVAVSAAPSPGAKAANPALPLPAPAPFNPYAFSAMAVLLNEGRPALEALLAQATTREQIVQLADAQSVRLDPAVAGNKKSSLTALRAAFADAVEKRIAHRRAVSG